MTRNFDADWNERLFEAMLGVAVEEAVLKEMGSLPSREELDSMYPPSDTFNRKIKRIIRKKEKTYRHKLATKAFLKAAACLGILFTISIVVLISVEASRIFILNTLISIQEDHVAFEFYGSVNSINNETEVLFEGFEHVTSQISDNKVISTYVSFDGDQIIFQQHEGTNLRIAIDNDYREFSSINIYSQEAYLFESMDEDYHVVMWAQENTVYIILSRIDVRELLMHAEAIIRG